jgi:hypothetical protein
MGNTTSSLSNIPPIPIKWIGDPESTNTVIDDLRVPVQTLSELGATTPPWKVWKDIPGSATDYAIEFDGVVTGSVPDYAALDVAGNAAIEIIVKPSTLNGTFVSRSGVFELYIDNGYVGLDIDDEIFEATDQILAGTKSHIAFNIEVIGPRLEVSIYIDGILSRRRRRRASLAAAATGLDFGYDGSGNHISSVVDEFVMYNKLLTEAQIVERYNGGGCSSTLPTGITEATDVVAWFQFNENTGTTVDNNCTLGAGSDMTLTADTQWTTGLVDDGSAGLFLARRAFSPTVRQVIHFSLQTPHGYKEGSDMDLHVHWSKKDDVAGDVCWKAYYSGAAIGGTFPAPTLLGDAGGDTATNGRHNMTILGDIDGSNLTTVSNMIDVVLWREPTDPTDTYPGDAYFNETDTHIELVMSGSRTRYVQ